MLFEGFIIDSHMGKQTPMTEFKTTVVEEYWKAFAAAGLRPRQLGPLSGFFPGNSDVEARTRAFQNMMEPRKSGPFIGTAKYCLMCGAIPLLEQQIRQAQTDPKNAEKRFKDKRRPQDLLDPQEYCAGHDPGYFEPAEVPEAKPVNAMDLFHKRQQINRLAERRKRSLQSLH